MKRGNKIILAIGAFLFVFMLGSLILMSRSLQNSELFDRYYSYLLVLNAVGLFSLIILIMLNIKRLIRQFKNHIIGSRMTIRMVMIFSVLSVTPVLIVYYFSLDFLHRGIDSWFDLRVEQALDDSLELSRLALDVRMRELLNSTEKIADELSEIDSPSVPLEIDKIRARINADELTILTRNGAIIASSSSDTKSLVPDLPGETILLQLFQGNSYIGLDVIKNTELYIRVVATSPAVYPDKDVRIVQALFPISERMNQLAESVQSAFIEYKELSYLRGQLKISFVIILTLVLLFSIFSAVWAAFYSANNLAAPIKNLAQGTRAIADGNYNTRLPVPSNDELGFLVASFNDMTDKIAHARDTARLSQQQAESQRAYLETVLSRLLSGVMVFDCAGNLEISNISAAQILQIDTSGQHGKNIEAIMNEHPRLNAFFECILNNIGEKLDDWREQITLTDNNEELILMVRGAILNKADAANNDHIIVFDEITALIKGQRDAAWSEMARRLAHEIKNPLTPIQLAAERIRHKYLASMEPDNADTLERMTNTIVQQVETMKEMVNNFSDYAHSPEYEFKEINIKTLIMEVLDLFGNLDFGNRIETDIDSNLPFISGDEKKLRQVFNNLLTNAVAANAMENDNYLKISAKNIDGDGNNRVEIRVIDKGSGLEHKIKNKLFEPYVTARRKGTGLGLAIVKRIIDEHKGQVWLENNKAHKGACAVIRLAASANVAKRNKHHG